MNETYTIKRTCYDGNRRPRIWWWKIVDHRDEILADGFSSKTEAQMWADAQKDR